MADRKKLKDIAVRRKSVIRSRNISEKDYILYRTFNRNSHDSKEATVVLGAAIMEQADLVAGDRVRVYTSDDDRTLGIGLPNDGVTGWKLCPYSYHAEGFDGYDEAMGQTCTCTFHFTIQPTDKVPLISHESSIEIPRKAIDVNRKELISIVFEIPEK